MSDDVKSRARQASDALFRLEESLGSFLDADGKENPNFDLRQRIYRARIEVNNVAFMYASREKNEVKP